MDNLRLAQETSLKVYTNYENDQGGSSHADEAIKSEVNHFNNGVVSTILPANVSQLLVLGGYGNGKELPLSICLQGFVDLLRSTRIPQEFLHCVAANNGSLALFVDYGQEGNSDPVFLHTIFQSPFSSNRDFSAAIRIDIGSGNVLALLFDRSELTLQKTINEVAFEATKTDKSPLDLLLLLFRTYGGFNEEWRAKLDSQVVAMERRSGMTSIDTSQFDSDDETAYAELTRDLHACNTDLIFLGHVLDFELELGAFCSQAFDTFEELRRQRREAPFHDKRAAHCFQQRLAYCVKDGEFRQRQTEALRTRVQSQINLLYSLISQRDSRVNIISAESSRQLAEDARKDSRTIKTIALMTLIFLPGTLVASIFSTEVFNLNPTPPSNNPTSPPTPESSSPAASRGSNSGDNERFVARLWWVFALAVVVATGLVLGIWIFWERRRNRNRDRGREGEWCED